MLHSHPGYVQREVQFQISVSNYPDDKPLALAIAAMTEEEFTDETVSPCGNCRQVIAEEESRTGNSIRIILSGKNKVKINDSIGSLLPLQFNKKNLKNHPSLIINWKPAPCIFLILGRDLQTETSLV